MRLGLCCPRLFLAGGTLVSDGFLGLIHITPDSEIVSVTADLALFAVLFTDGMHVSLPNLRANWRNPARALGLGMPLSFVYGLLVLQSGIPQAEEAFTLIAVCIAFSIVAHSSTDVPIARAFDVDDLAGIPDGRDGEDTDAPTRPVPQTHAATGGP
ncbi:cation:proton antiporter [Streptomyces sp. NPDC020362]|uniref:cation:proton antiporter domain-containing protein n=1 Tax=Streptomyces sp. NPDC020362 TaxID=3154486 RepID=UPI000B1F86CC